MATTRARHTITETDDVAEALDDAARHWPDDGDARGQLLRRLIEEGHRAIMAAEREQANRRRAAVRRTSGAVTGAYPAGYLEQLRDEWPA